VPRPSNSGRPKAPSPQRFTVSLLLRQPILFVLNAPTLLAFGVEGPLALGFHCASNEIDNESIQHAFELQPPG
jgi:hypothetical protein